MKMNEDKLMEAFDGLERLSYSDGFMIPYLLDRKPVYGLSEEERQELFNGMSEDAKTKYYDAHVRDREMTIRIMNRADPDYRSFKDYHEDELKSFLMKYPQYKVLLEE